MSTLAPATRERIARLAIRCHFGLLIVLLGGLIRWWMSNPIGSRAAAAVVMLIPALLPIRGILRRQRTTFAWGTLCLIPYIVVGITELVANPAGRPWAAGCLLLSFGTFLGFIAYLRASRPTADASP